MPNYFQASTCNSESKEQKQEFIPFLKDVTQSEPRLKTPLMLLHCDISLALVG